MATNLFRPNLEPSGYPFRVWDDYQLRRKGIRWGGPPYIKAISLSEAAIDENLQLRHSLLCNRRDPERFIWSISGGPDAAQFDVAFGHPWTLRWSQDGTKDFELPDDTNKDNIYEVQVTVTDAVGGYTDSQSITITVRDVIDSPLPELPAGFAYVIDVTGAYVKWGEAFCIAEVQV